MLVILAVFPVASPSESLRLEEAVAEVAFPNHVHMFLAAVEIGTGCSRFYHFLAVLQSFVVRIVEGVEMKRKLKLEELLALIALSSLASQ